MKKTLIVLGSPIWASLLLAALCVAVSLYAVLWCMVLVLWVVELAFAVVVPACTLLSALYAFDGDFIYGGVLLSLALVFAGITIFTYYGCKAASKGAVFLTLIPIGRLRYGF